MWDLRIFKSKMAPLETVMSIGTPGSCYNQQRPQHHSSAWDSLLLSLPSQAQGTHISSHSFVIHNTNQPTRHHDIYSWKCKENLLENYRSRSWSSRSIQRSGSTQIAQVHISQLVGHTLAIRPKKSWNKWSRDPTVQSHSRTDSTNSRLPIYGLNDHRNYKHKLINGWPR